ncbi:diacylglycerol kinase family protein [Synechococcus sp. CCY9202]|uniref:diacylglycerol kinase family protein n=1 Tax=Synechococcus sp. CCY9202 TaxID=174698 RepID=UPI002B202D02|nr:diacylglycerol kinase family protein [Synechococcus sp. CCY9202]MEA5421746.1 diacylglycerol kinase family protein [Synechococcus sp. CCY9202]
MSVPPGLVLLASPARRDALLAWVRRHRALLAPFALRLTADLAEPLQLEVSTADLRLEMAGTLEAGGDISLAAAVLAQEVMAVVAFLDPAAPVGSPPELPMLLRACQVRDVPLLLNEASATLALRGLSRGRLATLIFNPVAGQRDPNQDLAQIRSILEPQLQVHVCFTQPDLDPAEQARALLGPLRARQARRPDSALMIACGGDGTVSAVAGALLDSGLPLGVIPRGTANAFAGALGIPTDLPGACRTVLAGHIQRMDAALCNDTPMVLLAGVGFEAGMVDRATRELKNRLGPLAYVLAGAQQLVNQQPFQAHLEIDGKAISLQASAITVANAAPGTSVLAQGFGRVIADDGLLEVTIATSTDRLQGLQALASLAASAVVQTPAQHGDLLCLRARRITIATATPQKLVVDGEMLEGDRFCFECLPGSLRVFAPLPLP